MTRVRGPVPGREVIELSALTGVGVDAWQGNVVGNGSAASIIVRGSPGSPSALMVINARARTTPQRLRAAVEHALAQAAAGRGVSFQVTELASLRPGRPTPVHRFETPA